MTLGACATFDMPVQFSDITAARFHFVGLLNASNEAHTRHELVKISSDCISSLIYCSFLFYVRLLQSIHGQTALPLGVKS